MVWTINRFDLGTPASYLVFHMLLRTRQIPPGFVERRLPLDGPPRCRQRAAVHPQHWSGRFPLIVETLARLRSRSLRTFQRIAPQVTVGIG